MNALKSLVRAAIVGAAAAALASCVTVFPETKPAQLYRFGAAAPPPPATEATAKAEPVGVLKSPTGFGRAISGDGILTVTGDQAAYVAEARWVAPASVLFDEALAQAFDDNAGPVRLVVRGEISRAVYRLRVDVRNFEALYDAGPHRPPTVVVRLRAVLTRTDNRAPAGDDLFEVRVKAHSNRVGAIVEAFDEAAGQAINQVVAWTNEKAAPLA